MIAPVQSLQRAIRILYFVAGKEDGCSVVEIASGVNLKQITAYKLIRTLEAEGLMTRLGPPLRFTLGDGIHELKHLDDGRVWLTESAQVLLQAQREMPEASFVLLQSIDGNTYQRLRLESAHFGRLFWCRQYQLHPYEKASALLFLAHYSPKEAANFYERHPFENEGVAFWESKESLEAFLAKVRRRKYSQPNLPHEVYYRVSAPIWSASGKLLAAVGVFIRHSEGSRQRKREVLEICLRTAHVLSSQAGSCTGFGLERIGWP